MTLAYVLDTNALSQPMLRQPDPRLTIWHRQHANETATCAPALHEFAYGGYRMPPGRRREAIVAYVRELVAGLMPILPYDVAAADWHAAERARLERLGRTPAYIDGQIAAVAVVNDLTLVTANVADFQGFRDLRVLDWRV